jgi:hypothetical protein
MPEKVHRQEENEMVRIYLAPYHARGETKTTLPCGKGSIRLSGEMSGDEWPYDIGDDPSFSCSKMSGGPLTWGICRPDVRNPIRLGDIVVFFSFREIKEAMETEYRLCAVATVNKKVRMTDLWKHPELERFKSYDNLLIKPNSRAPGCWKHFEPKLKGQQGHSDWLWRICEHPKRVLKDSFDGRDEFCRDEKIEGHPLGVAQNYVIFSTRREETCILHSPPLMARHYGGKGTEVWENDGSSAKVFRLTLGEANRVNGSGRFLRIPGSGGHPHRHVKWEVPRERALQWRGELIEFAKTVRVTALKK